MATSITANATHQQNWLGWLANLPLFSMSPDDLRDAWGLGDALAESVGHALRSVAIERSGPACVSSMTLDVEPGSPAAVFLAVYLDGRRDWMYADANRAVSAMESTRTRRDSDYAAIRAVLARVQASLLYPRVTP